MRSTISLCTIFLCSVILSGCSEESDQAADKNSNKKEAQELAIGSKAPEFTLADQNGEMHTLADYKGKNVVLYFYPKDDTRG